MSCRILLIRVSTHTALAVVTFFGTVEAEAAILRIILLHTPVFRLDGVSAIDDFRRCSPPSPAASACHTAVQRYAQDDCLGHAVISGGPPLDRCSSIRVRYPASTGLAARVQESHDTGAEGHSVW